MVVVLVLSSNENWHEFLAFDESSERAFPKTTDEDKQGLLVIFRYGGVKNVDSKENRFSSRPSR